MSKTSRREFLLAAVAGASTRIFPPVSGAHASPLGQEGGRGRTRPNILLFFPDQHRFDWIGMNTRHIPVRTPHLDRLARDGVLFRKAVVASPLCAPSRACLASGKEYERCRVPSNAVDYPLSEQTFYSLLRESGYWVTGCGKLDLHKRTRYWGLDGKWRIKEEGFSEGIDNGGKGDAVSSGRKAPQGPYMAYLYRRNLASIHIEDFMKRSGGHNPGGGAAKTYAATWPTPLPEDAYCDNWVGRNGLELMRQFPEGKPWYLTVNFAGPHNPMDITRRMEKLVRGRIFPQPNGCKIFSPHTHVLIRENYTAMVENIDRWVGIYVEELQRRGEMENTLVVYSSDHGEMLGDHNRWAKSMPYQPSVSVPLILRGPGVKAMGASEALVSTMDLTATFLDFAGVTRPAGMDSRSLKSLLAGRTQAHREFVRSGLGSWRLVFDGRYKLIRGFDPDRPGVWTARTDQTRYETIADTAPLLFDLESDPLENNNIAANASGVVRRLSKFLES